MISARGVRADITNILLEGEHIDLDIQENVSVHVLKLNPLGTIWFLCTGHVFLYIP